MAVSSRELNATALKHALLTRPEAVPDKLKRDLAPIIRKYIPDRDRSLVDELIEERRREAERE